MIRGRSPTTPNPTTDFANGSAPALFSSNQGWHGQLARAGGLPARQNRAICAPFGADEFASIPCGKLPHGTGKLPVLPDSNCIVSAKAAPVRKARKLRLDSLQHPELQAIAFEVSLQFVFALPDLLRRIGTQPDVFIVSVRLGTQREVTHPQVARQIGLWTIGLVERGQANSTPHSGHQS